LINLDNGEEAVNKGVKKEDHTKDSSNDYDDIDGSAYFRKFIENIESSCKTTSNP
jgi:hypothetical protein